MSFTDNKGFRAVCERAANGIATGSYRGGLRVCVDGVKSSLRYIKRFCKQEFERIDTKYLLNRMPVGIVFHWERDQPAGVTLAAWVRGVLTALANPQFKST